MNDRIDSDFLQIFLHSHFITTSPNNRRQLNDNDLRPNSLKLIKKNLVGNYEPIMRVGGKIFIINLHNLQMLFML